MGPSFIHSLPVRARWNEDGNPIFRLLAVSPAPTWGFIVSAG